MITLRQIWLEIRFAGFTTRYVVAPYLKARRAGRVLAHRSGPAAPKGDLVAVAPYYGNEPLLRAFLDHHRGLGVDLFVLLDLSADGALHTYCDADADCAVWRPRDATKLGQTVLWLNELRRRYGTGRWCLSLEPCEFLVFPHSETRKLKDLIEFVQTERRDHVFGIAIDMYGDRPAEQSRLEPGQSPFDLSPYFDPTGYVTAVPGRWLNTLVRGGPQRRALFGARAPALNRVPLVKWRWFFNYAAGTRLMMPRYMNRAHGPWHTTPTACLLRFAELNDEATLRRAAEAEAGELAGDGGGGSYLGALRLRRFALKTDISRRFSGSADLVECGLLNPGQWF